ncbi:MAG: hypothetical protein ACJAU5_001729 [Maricaulis maris]|jgi:hypothetical protein
MPNSIRGIVGQKPWRAIGAWLLTCYLVSVVVIGGLSAILAIEATFLSDISANWRPVTMSPLWGVPAGLVTAAMTALPVWAAVSILRATRWPRPLCEVVLGLILAVLLLQLADIILSFNGSELDGRPVGLPIWVYVYFGAVGAAAGWTYWRLAGRPGRVEDTMSDAIGARVFD